jgi:hypothetical protein
MCHGSWSSQGTRTEEIGFLQGQTVLRHGTETCALEPFHSPQLSVHIICRLKFDVYWWTNLFPDMSQTPSVSNLNIHVEIYYATCSLNQWIDYLPIRNREQQSDHIYYTLLWQVSGFAMLLTRLSNQCKHAGSKPFWWAKLACFDFSRSNFNLHSHILRALVELL